MTQQPSPRRFDGLTVLVTGGANGIGLATAQRFAAEGGKVWVADMDQQTPAKAAAFGGAGVICDVAEPGEIDRLVDVIVGKTGKLDVAVAAAGMMLMIGLNSSAARKHPAVTTAVSPVRPPASTPAADSM